MSDRKKAYVEVYKILQELDKEEYQKIPFDIINTIKTNMDKEYQFELKEELELKDQNLLPETKAILFNLFRDYLATEKQKKKIIKMQNEERIKSELRKEKKYENNIWNNK